MPDDITPVGSTSDDVIAEEAIAPTIIPHDETPPGQGAMPGHAAFSTHNSTDAGYQRVPEMKFDEAWGEDRPTGNIITTDQNGSRVFGK